MFVVFILLWVIAILLIYANPKTTWAWWASSCLFLNGFGGVAVLFNDNIIPFVNKTNDSNIMFLCLAGKYIANVLQHYFATYAFIGFVLHFTNFLNINLTITAKHIILTLLAIPSIMMLISYYYGITFEPNYKVLSAWVVLYTLIANIILIISILKEKDNTKRYQKFLVGLFAIPTTLSIMWTSYLSVAVGYHEVWYFNYWIILFQFTIFIIMALKNGVLGVRLRVERCNLDETIDTVINGMSVISHAVKNEAATISLCVDTIRCTGKVDSNTDKKLSIIKESSNGLSDFTQRINKFRIFEMDLEPFVLNIIVEKVIRQVMPITSGKDIKIINSSKEDVTIMIDAVHITEVLKNLLINAIEAIEIEGTIYIETEVMNENVCLSVIDNGVGIPQKSIEKVLTPFYSTKKGKNNFGLGLSYCYKVMKCHKGCLKISSVVNQGTKMSLFFPIERVLNIKNSVSTEVE